MESAERLFRGRGGWLGDLAVVAAAGMGERRRAWGVGLLVVSVAITLLLGVEGLAFPVSAGIVVAALRVPHDRRRRLWRTAFGVLATTIVIVVLYGTFTGDPQPFERRVMGFVFLVGSAMAAVALPQGTRWRWGFILILLTALAALGWCVILQHSWYRWQWVGYASRNTIALQVAVFVLLGQVARRGPWVLWTLVVATAVSVMRIQPVSSRELVICLAGPVGVAFAARLGSAVQAGATAADGDAAVVRLARAVQWRPWITTLVTCAVAWALAFSFWTTFAILMEPPSQSGGWEVAFFALPGPFTVVVAVLFHGLLRAESLTDRLAALVAPLLAVGGGLGVFGLGYVVLAAASVMDVASLVRTYVGYGPLLPALTGLVLARIAGPGARAWPAALLASAACGIAMFCLAWPDVVGTLLAAVGAGDARGMLPPLFAVPWLLAFHRLVVSGTSLRTLLVWSVVLGTLVGLTRLGEMHELSKDAVHQIAGMAALVSWLLALAALGAVLARRLRDMSVLPRDHAVTIWKTLPAEPPVWPADGARLTS